MRTMHRILRWVLLVALAGALVVGVLDVTGGLAPTYRWFVHYFAPEVWSALAAWFAVAVGIVTVIVAGRYARQQVEKAQDQILETQTARRDQERQAREAIATQVRLAEEQARPVVVIYSELNPEEMQFVEIVIKNYGPTPAYDVEVAITPELKASPNLVSGERLADVPIPIFPILAPGQEWRTGWDFSMARKDYREKYDRLTKPEDQLSSHDKFEIEYLQSENAYPLERLASRHEATVTFEDEQNNVYTTRAVLDCDLYLGTTKFSAKTIHSLVQLLEDKMPTQNVALGKIAAELHSMGTEHRGLWVYGSGDESERELRRAITERDQQENREFGAEIEQAMERSRQRLLRRTQPDTDSGDDLLAGDQQD